jgi:hypothetical protein
MKRQGESLSTKTVQIQVMIDLTTLKLIEAYRKRTGLSSRAQAARALIVKGLLRAAMPRPNKNFPQTIKYHAF